MRLRTTIVLTVGLGLWPLNPVSGQGTECGKLRFLGGGSPGSATFFCFIKNIPGEIATEDGYNSALGTDQGYTFFQGEGFWLVNFGNFQQVQASPGDRYDLYFSTGDQTGYRLGTVPFSLGDCNLPVTLLQAAGPTTPNITQAYEADGNAVLVWVADENVSYLVYRSLLPSGAENGASNGVYRLQKAVEAGRAVVSSTSSPNQWFLVISRDSSGNYSGHSEEATLGTPPPPTGTPTVTPTPAVTPSPTSTPTSTPSSTETPTASPTSSPTSSPTPSATWTPTPTGTFTPTATPTATIEPTFTATLSVPTATVTETPAPPILLLAGGYLDTALSQADGGVLSIFALSTDAGEVELFTSGLPSGILIPATGVGGFLLQASFDPGALSPAQYLLELAGRTEGDLSSLWPYLTVTP